MHLVLSDLQGMLLCGAEHLAFSLAYTYPSLIFCVKWERKPTDLHCNDPEVSFSISCCEERQTMTKQFLCLKNKALSLFSKTQKCDPLWAF